MNQQLAHLSVVIPTYKREAILVDSLTRLGQLLKPGDEILVIDQTPQHEPATDTALQSMATSEAIRYYKRSTPSQNEAMNIGALLARNEILVFLDDDILPFEGLLEGHRNALDGTDGPPATCGQVLQPWNPQPVETVNDFDFSFDSAYSRRCEVRYLIGANFAIRRSTYFAVGGMDENFNGANYRNDAEMAYRICEVTGKRILFVPEAGLRHLLAQGGNRAFGAKDTWGHIGGSIGDYYFALKWLRGRQRLAHIATRPLRASLNRNTVTHPWLIPSMAVREVVAFFRAWLKLARTPYQGMQTLDAYGPLHHVAPDTHEPV